MSEELAQVVIRSCVQGLYGLGPQIIRADAAAARRREEIERAISSNDEIRVAIRRAVGWLLKTPGLDPARGREPLRNFLASIEADQISRQIHAAQLTASLDTHVTHVQRELSAALALWLGVARGSAEPHANQLFDALCAACDTAMRAARRQNVVIPIEPGERARLRRAHDELANIAPNGTLLSTGRLDLPAILEFEEAYRARAAEAHAWVYPPSLDEKVRKHLDDVYVDQRVRPYGGDRLLVDDAVEVLATVHRGVILGDPGGGKSTLLAKVAVEMASGRVVLPPTARTPIVVVLRDYAKRAASSSIVQELIRVAVTDLQFSEVPAHAFDYLLRNGRAAVLFDGLDELLDTDDRMAIAKRVEAFADAYSSAPILVTSRVVGYREAPLRDDRFRVSQLDGFSPAQTKAYVLKFFGWSHGVRSSEAESHAEQFLRDSASVPDLRSNPLMLGLLCSMYRGAGTLPAERSAVLEKCALLLYERWDKDRGIMVRFPFPSKLHSALQYLAYTLYTSKDDAAGVTERRLVGYCTDYLLGSRYEDADEATAAAREFIALCRGRAWVFTETGTSPRGEPLFHFTHRTFMEYFAAGRLVATERNPAVLVARLKPRIERQEWEVVCQLALHIQARDLDADDELLEELTEGDPERASPNVVAFCLRALEHLVPGRALLRALTRCVLPRIAALAQYAAPVEAQELARAMARVSPENRETIADELHCAAGPWLNPHNAPREHLSVASVLLHLERYAGGGPDTEAYDFWSHASDRIAADHSHAVRALARRYNAIGYEAVYRGVQSLTEFAAQHTIAACFRENPLLLEADDAPPLALALLASGAQVPVLGHQGVVAERHRGILGELSGQGLYPASRPWFRAGQRLAQGHLADWLAAQEPTADLRTWPEEQRTGILLALAALRELTTTVLEASVEPDNTKPWTAREVAKTAYKMRAEPGSDVEPVAALSSDDTVRGWLAGELSLTR